MKIDGVFSGGGVKALAFIGALEVLEEKGFSFERLAGTSAGSIIASFIAAGYKSHEIKEMMMELDLSTFIEEPKFGRSIPFLKWILMYFRLGVYNSSPLEKWIENKLKVKGITTFGDLPDGYLKMIGSDITESRIVVFPDDLQRFYQIDGKRFPIAKAVRISSTIPFFFIPLRLPDNSNQKSILVDGGILSNFPLWLFTEDGKKTRPLLGMKLSSTYEHLQEKKVEGVIEMYKALFTTMMKAHDARHIDEASSDEIMFIPTGDIEATDFGIDQKKKEILIESGKKSAIKFLKKWRY